MRGLGSVVLAAVLLGVPRGLNARTFGAPQSVYVEVAPLAPELTDFAAELERALGKGAYSLASRRSEATTVVEVRSVTRVRATDGQAMEAATLVVREGASERPWILHYTPRGRARAAAQLLEHI